MDWDGFLAVARMLLGPVETILWFRLVSRGWDSSVERKRLVLALESLFAACRLLDLAALLLAGVDPCLLDLGGGRGGLPLSLPRPGTTLLGIGDGQPSTGMHPSLGWFYEEGTLEKRAWQQNSGVKERKNGDRRDATTEAGSEDTSNGSEVDLASIG